MTSKLKIAIACGLVLLSVLACATLVGEDGQLDSGYDNAGDEYYEEDSLEETPQSLASPIPESTSAPLSCPAITDQIVSLAQAGGEEYEEDLLDGDIYLVTYAVYGNEISDPYFEDASPDFQDEQEDEAKHMEVWDYFSNLIPLDERPSLTEYSIVTDGRGGSLAAVTQTTSNASEWALEVDIADTGNYYDLTYTLIHEFGHLLTLDPQQVTPSLAVFNNPDDDDIYLQEVSRCPNYFPGEGCAQPDSYINSFYNQFWANIYEEWNDINLIEDDDAYYDALDEFYYEYEDWFVTSYAPTNPEEDIAESFAFFIFGPMPVGATIAEEKTLFFYEFPELVQLRSTILSNACLNFPQ